MTGPFPTHLQISGVSYLLQQDMETNANPQANFTNSASGVNMHDTTSPIEGTADCTIVSSNTNYTYATISSQSEVWVYFKFRIDTSLPTSSFATLLQINHSGTAVNMDVRLENTGNLSVRCNLSGASATTVATTSFGTIYHVWAHYKQGSGSNALYSIGFSTDGTEPSSGDNFAGGTNGSGTDIVDQVLFMGGESGTGGGTYHIDHVRISIADPGNSPA